MMSKQLETMLAEFRARAMFDSRFAMYVKVIVEIEEIEAGVVTEDSIRFDGVGLKMNHYKETTEREGHRAIDVVGREDGGVLKSYRSKYRDRVATLMREVHPIGDSDHHEVTRLYKDKEHAEVEFTIGPIPMDDGVEKEVITRMTTNMPTEKTFYTDSNGRDFLKRLNLGIFTMDDKSEFSVLVDRATGAGSIEDGELEIMLHRRMIFDDGRGVGEALDESVCVEDTCEGLTNTESWKASYVTNATAMDPSYSLPPNVALITLQELDDGNMLLRLAHLYEAGEDAEYSNTAKVELKKMFAGKMIMQVTVTSLSANQEKSKMNKMKWKIEGDSEEQPISVRGGPVDPSTLIIELSPMEIRTFLLKL
ncbi:hypothetical protein GIB67_015799 [Kingdonia uniflora]|uniref:Alpha-mannosidase n=1 Tax=Kingdonia uniflora TaxID=39325 RepID=A0A7J7NUH2_9MAGN|nr:hypothetical protein GIB67_015799 [Kingdonia uniflora]